MSAALELREADENEVLIKQKLLQNIVNALDKNKSADHSKFYAEDNLLMDDIKVEIDEVGELSFPLSEKCLKKLLNVSSNIHFLSQDQTSQHENIHNTHEITSDKLLISFNQQALDCMMNKLRISFGFKDNCILFPQLCNMLIFGAGEVSDFNQESEKLENMIGLLVIVLPNAHNGGDLVINFGKKEHIFASEGIFPVKAKCFAFDAECKQRMRKVNAGYRIALIYNLVLKIEKLVVPSLVKNRLSKAVEKYFDLKEDEQKLVYLLSHSYSEYSLKWNILKGNDHANSLALFATAEQLGLVSHLALVEIKENWGMYAKESLIYKHIILYFWVDSNNKTIPYSKYYVSETDMCFTKETSEFEPHDERFEECSGNDLTISYRYRRAAIVLWSESDKFSMNFTLGYDYFLSKLVELCQSPGNKKEVIDIVTQARKKICENQFETTEETHKNFLNLSCIALYIDSSETAFSLLSNSEWKALSVDFAEPLSNLQFKYGVQWCINLINKMKSNSHNHDLVDSNQLIRPFSESKVDIAVMKLILDVQYELIINEIAQNSKKQFEDLKSSLPERIGMLHEFFTNCLICEDYKTLSKMIQNVVLNIQQYPFSCLTELFIENQISTENEQSFQFNHLRSLTETIDPETTSNVLNEDDWSINFQLPCSCEYCEITTSFLQSKTERTKVWPLREKLRKHIIGYFRISGLPVEVNVEKTGSPYKLVLIKTDTLLKDNISE